MRDGVWKTNASKHSVPAARAPSTRAGAARAEAKDAEPTIGPTTSA